MLLGVLSPDQASSTRARPSATKLIYQELPGLDHIVGNNSDEREISLESASVLQALHCPVVVFGA